MPESANNAAPAPLQAVPPAAREGLYFRLLIRALGHDPSNFSFQRFLRRSGLRSKIEVFGRSSGAVYEADESGSWTSEFAADLKTGRFDAERPPVLRKDMLVVLRHVIATLEESGLDAGLKLLNEAVPHRFTALYRLDSGVMRNVALVDKERNTDSFALQAVPLTDSFCQFALRDGVFLTTASRSDERLAGHPYRGVVGSYVGVPVSLGKTLYGTLCHLDFDEQQIDEKDFILLQHVALQLPSPALP
jgi:GAF domain-containing protein